MNVVVIGAAGKTGQLVVERAINAGHQVTAFVHSAEGYTAPTNVRVVVGDASDQNAVDQAVADQQAVIDAIGGDKPFLKTDLERTAAQTIVNAMQQHGVNRLIAVSMWGVGDSKEHAGFFYEHLVLPTFLRGAREDKTAMENTIQHSNLQYVIVRPPYLSDDAAKGSVHIITGDEKADSITRADLAQFIVDQLSSDSYVNQAIIVANS